MNKQTLTQWSIVIIMAIAPVSDLNADSPKSKLFELLGISKDATVDEGVKDNNKQELLSNSIKPSMTKRELVESVRDISEASVKPSRRVIKTVRIKDLRNE